ncbi:MAG: BolA family transcriptional regulator [Rubrivivax sp.]|nr:BolA family transcriptional regulator [Rubrivivax sp.]
MSAVRLSAADIETRLRSALAPEALAVEDDSHHHAGHAGAREGGHFTVRVTSVRFAGLPRLARHRLVYDALGSLGAQGVHALAIVARAPGEPE